MTKILIVIVLFSLLVGCGGTRTISTVQLPYETATSTVPAADAASARQHLDNALSLWFTNQTPAALVELDLGRKADPANWEIHYYRGLLLTELGLYGEAARAEEQALAHAPAAERRLRGRIYLALGEARERGGDLIRARLHYRTALDLMPDWSLAAISLERVN